MTSFGPTVSILLSFFASHNQSTLNNYFPTHILLYFYVVCIIGVNAFVLMYMYSNTYYINRNHSIFIQIMLSLSHVIINQNGYLTIKLNIFHIKPKLYIT
jgi:hypothetical protein